VRSLPVLQGGQSSARRHWRKLNTFFHNVDFQRSPTGAVKEKKGNPNKIRQKRPAATLEWVKSRE
jgi:hypothetical protein